MPLENLAQYGLPAVLTGFLIWWLTQSLSDRMDKQTKAIRTNTRAVRYLASVLLVWAKTNSVPVSLEELDRHLGNGNDEDGDY